jgi:hypothetical protein
VGVVSCYEDNLRRQEDAATASRPVDPELAALLAAPKSPRRSVSDDPNKGEELTEPSKALPRVRKIKRCRAGLNHDRRLVIGQPGLRVCDLLDHIQNLEGEIAVLRACLKRQADELRKRRK